MDSPKPKPEHQESPGSRRDPEERPARTQAELREKMLDKTLADSFPTSDPPSSIPDPVAEDSLQPKPSPARSEAASNAATDPVCHRQVETANSTIKTDYEGRVYHFCSEECKEVFQTNPAFHSKAA